MKRIDNAKWKAVLIRGRSCSRGPETTAPGTGSTRASRCSLRSRASSYSDAWLLAFAFLSSIVPTEPGSLSRGNFGCRWVKDGQEGIDSRKASWHSPATDSVTETSIYVSLDDEDKSRVQSCLLATPFSPKGDESFKDERYKGGRREKGMSMPAYVSHCKKGF